MFWGTLLESAMKILKNERISGGALILMGAALFSMYAWADTAHNILDENSKTRHQQNIEEMVSKEEFEELQATVDVGFEEINLNDASAEIRDIKLSRQIAQATGAGDDEVARIEDQLNHAKAYKSCLVERRPNCDHLREVE